MIDLFNTWAKNIILAVMIVSIFEMILPKNKNTKYIKMIMGLYILFNIISPLIGKNIKFDINEIMQENQTQEVSNETINQESMDKRLKQIGEEELEKDIIDNIEREGYIVNYCKVELEIGSESKIKNITLQIQKNENQKEEKQIIENKLVEEIQKIKKVQISKQDNEKQSEKEELTEQEIKNIKKILVQEYEVNETCLKIN